MALPKAHHIETLSEFNSLKFSYDSTNTHYFTGGTSTVVEGTPDILYTDIAYIKPLSAIYTHAKLYPCPILEYDNAPTAGSDNLVTSDGIKSAIDSVTYTAGTGLKLSNNEFSLSVPNSSNVNTLPGNRSVTFNKIIGGTSDDLPESGMWLVMTIQGEYSAATAQIAIDSGISLSGPKVYARSRAILPSNSEYWGAWTSLVNTDTTYTFDDTPTASSNNPVKSGGIDSAIKNNQRVFYAVTETAGATAVKEFTISDFPTETINGVKTPLKGTILIAQCANQDSRSAQLKFKVNDGGEFPIRYNNAEWTSTSTSGTVFGTPNQNYVYAFDGSCWCWVSHGYENNTTYTAGSGLKLSGTQFSLNVPRVAKSANSLPGKNTAIIEEYSAGDNYNLPTNAWYHILTFEGTDTNYATQLALCMSGVSAYYRNYYNGTWQSWKRLDNPTMDSTPTAGNTANTVSSAGVKTYVDNQVATKSNVVIRQWVTQ